jgi:hypothetical protein
MLGANGHRGLGLIYGGRVIAGMGVGGASMISPIYISEVSPPAIRGRLVGFYEFSWQIGGLVGFWINVKNPLTDLKAYTNISAVRAYTNDGSKPQTVVNCKQIAPPILLVQ